MRRSLGSSNPAPRRPRGPASATDPLPAPSRLSVRSRAVAALRRTRHAIEEIEVQLEGILDHLHGRRPLDHSAPDRLRASANEARAAMASLSDFGDLYG